MPLSFGERSVGLHAAIEHGRRVLESGVERLGIEAPELVVIPQLRRQHPHELVGEELDADLLVLGGPRPRTPARLGLIDSSAVQHAPCPILFLRDRPMARGIGLRRPEGAATAPDTQARHGRDDVADTARGAASGCGRLAVVARAGSADSACRTSRTGRRRSPRWPPPSGCEKIVFVLSISISLPGLPVPSMLKNPV